MEQSYDPDCLRRVANWSRLLPTHKFDSPTFRPSTLLRDIPKASPKIAALLSKMAELDAADMQSHGHLFKHYIFSEVKQGGYGAKIVASALIASGMKLVYTRSLKMKAMAELRKTPHQNMALMSSTTVYGAPLTEGLKREVFAMFNARPDNVHGDNIRVIVMDGGFKEGVDLFDVKYVHVLEPQVSEADLKQVVGRATRTCGQKGLVFHPQRGWPLHVMIYDTGAPNAESLFELFLKNNSSIDMRLVNLAEQIERYTIFGSVDYELSANLREFGARPLRGGSADEITCFTGNCGKARATNDVPATLALMAVTYLALGRSLPPSLKNTDRPRTFFCKALKSDPEYCAALNEAYSRPERFMHQHEAELTAAMKMRRHRYIASASSRRDITGLVYLVFPHLKPARAFPPRKRGPIAIPPPPAEGGFLAMRQYMRDHYSDVAWPRAKLENACEQQQQQQQQQQQLVFTPTQECVRRFFTPASPYKGLLLWHSVGVGKTCTAIAAASTSFEPAGYTIIWVTRTTLKQDIWKNMFDQVCSMSVRKLKGPIPADHAERMRLLSDSWSIHPISYRQFTNMIAGENDVYERLVKRNGSADPLRKTLIILDEAHKLYAGGHDLLAAERPNMERMHRALMHSYNHSGADSARLLLMSATPFSQDPLDLVRLMNLMRPALKQMPAELGAFTQRYLDSRGAFSSDGIQDYLDDISGYVSHLSRERDARQFAQPQISYIRVPVSESTTYMREARVRHVEAEIRDGEASIEQLDASMRQTLRRVKDACADAKVKRPCMERAGMGEYREQKSELEAHVAYVKEQKALLRKALSSARREAETSLAQSVVIDSKCRERRS